MAKICVHAVISGRVQGVWFRHFTREQAQASAVTGWVRNLSDGRVEALLCGEETAVRHVEAWLSRGPELANVAEVTSTDREYQPDLDGFDIIETDAE
ncbi:MAG: acylphosphatase [Oceanospirillales bacterium]|uniref:Acylphosphatase n=1 Tax=Marinobacterium halophilum TaxID=267374 RepID=A0A2P8EVE7_9GAMM|nr:acylphosphatase [Marinobacterium halophilum]MBR9829182.1 acylphosphatase [Oceanospirillales bacterium]PSL13447.1 acylphosphatase [Marinobacterium halophilum]